MSDVSFGGFVTEFVQGVFFVDGFGVGVLPDEEVVDGAVEQEAELFDVFEVKSWGLIVEEFVSCVIVESVVREEMQRPCDSFAFHNFDKIKVEHGDLIFDLVSLFIFNKVSKKINYI